MKKLIVLLMVVFFMMAGMAYAQTVDPKDLKGSDPKTPSLKTTPPPPLPEQKKEPTIIDKIKEKEKEKGIEPKQVPSTGGTRSEAGAIIQLAQVPEPPCVCAECGKKCGAGHETWCSSYRKVKPDIMFAADTSKEIKETKPKETKEIKETKPKENKALDQLKGVEKSSKKGKQEVEKGNLLKGKAKAGEGFDTPSSSTGTVKGSTGTVKETPKEISDRENKAQKEREKENAKKWHLDHPTKVPPKLE